MMIMKYRLYVLTQWLRLVITEVILGTLCSPTVAMAGPLPAPVLQGPNPPAVDAGPDQTTNEGDQVVFGGTVTDLDTPTGHAIVWDFGDGTTMTNTLIPTHVYADDGTSVQKGYGVLVPERMVEWFDGEAIAWWQLDLETGEMVGVGENGTHDFITAAAMVLLTVAITLLIVWIFIIWMKRILT